MQYLIEKGKCGSNNSGVVWFQSPNCRVHPTHFPVDNHFPWVMEKAHTTSRKISQQRDARGNLTVSKVTGFWIMDFYYADSKMFFLFLERHFCFRNTQAQMGLCIFCFLFSILKCLLSFSHVCMSIGTLLPEFHNT